MAFSTYGLHANLHGIQFKITAALYTQVGVERLSAKSAGLEHENSLTIMRL
jgi:hypothetical protein